MSKFLRVALLFCLFNNLIAQPLRFYDTSFVEKHNSLDAAADDKGGWLTLTSNPDSSFNIIQFDYCGKVIVNQNYGLPENTNLITPLIYFLGKDTSIITGTLSTSTGSAILVFYAVRGIINSARIITNPNSARSYKPMISYLDANHILLAYNYDTGSVAKSRIVMLNNNLSVRWSRNIPAPSQVKWIQMRNNGQFVVGDNNKVMLFDTIGTNIWSRQFPELSLSYNSSLNQDSLIVFLADYIADTNAIENFKQVIWMDMNGKLRWNSDLIRSMRTPYLAEFNSRLFYNRDYKVIFNGIDTLQGDSLPALFAHTLEPTSGFLIKSVGWAVQDSVRDYKSTKLNDGNFGVSVSLGNENIKGFGNAKTTIPYELCITVNDSNVVVRKPSMDSIVNKNILNAAESAVTLSIIGVSDTLKGFNRACEMFDLKDGEMPVPLCKGDSVFLAGLVLPNATYVWDNGSMQGGIYVKEPGDYVVTINYCDHTIHITFKVFFITFSDQDVTIEECDYPRRITPNRGDRATYKWPNGDTTDFFMVNGPGTYTVDVRECEMDYKINFHVQLKTFHDSTLTFAQCNYPDFLYADLGRNFKDATFKWDDGSTALARQINGPGTYFVDVSYCQSTFRQSFNIVRLTFRDSTYKFMQCTYPDILYGDLGRGFKDATYKWDNGSTEYSRNITGPGTYKVSVSYCQSNYVQTYEVSLPVFADSTYTFTQCNYPDVLYADLGQGLKDASFKWDNGSTAYTRTITGPGTYTVTITYCNSSFKKTFKIQLLNVQDTTFNISRCDFPFILDAGNYTGVTYLWLNNGTTVPTLSIAEAGVYRVKLSVCDTSFIKTFNVQSTDKLPLLPKDTVINASCELILAGLNLQAQQYPNLSGVTYAWKNRNEISSKILIEEPGKYTAVITYCAQSYDQNFDVKPLAQDYLVFPNVFPPTGSDANKIFKPFIKVDPVLIQDYQLDVYNRWGQRVFNSAIVSNGWNGDYEGESAPIDTYIYVATFTTTCDTHMELKGTFTLIR